MKHDAFNPRTSLSLIVAATTAPTPVQIAATPTPVTAFEITNAGGTDAFLCYASTLSAAAAIAAAGVPAVGTPAAGMLHIPAGSDKVYSVPADSYFTALTASGTTNLYLVGGEGL